MRQCAATRSRLLPALREGGASGYGAGCRLSTTAAHTTAAPCTPPPSMPAGYSTVNLPPVVPQPQRRSPLFKLLAIALVLILVAGLTILAGILYLGYRVGQKATHVARAISQATTSPTGTLRNPLQDLLANHAPGDDIPTLSASAPVVPCPPTPFPDQQVSPHPAETGHRADQCVGSQVWRCGAHQPDRLD